jgi:NAD-reducing hydrogenase small subunit
MERLRLATVWLGGCSGCHMSLLDLDEWLVDLAQRVEVVYSPLIDVKEFPERVDLALVEGAVSNDSYRDLIARVRARTRVLIALGDCAITGNVTALRNPQGGPAPLLERVYGAAAAGAEGRPELLERALPLHAVVPVELYLPGCPPPAPRIRAVLEQLLAGEELRLHGREMILFG